MFRRVAFLGALAVTAMAQTAGPAAWPDAVEPDPPEPADDAKRIWQVLAKQFEFALSDELIDELTAHFREISGRDIKELLKLTAKWCRQKNVPASLEVFRSCSQFRGL